MRGGKGIDYAQHIETLGALIDSRCSGELQRTLADRLARIRKKQADGRMYVALVGEFNAGKSSFVNALLRENRFEVSMLPTTAEAAYVEHENFTIVDTPGFNPGDEALADHQRVTKEVVEQVADMALVLIPATRGISATLLSFLETHLSRFLHRCIFVLTKADMIEAEEREELVGYVRHQLQNKLNLAQPKIFVESAMVLNYPLQLEEEEREYWQGEFERFERFLVAHVRTYRETVLSEHLLALLLPLIQDLRRVMKRKLKEAVAEREFIQAQNIVHIRKLTRQIYKETKRTIQEQFRAINSSSQPYVERCLEELHELINETGLLELKEKLGREGERIIKRKSSAYFLSVRKPVEHLQKELGQLRVVMEREFAAHYQNLPYAYPGVPIDFMLQRDQVDVVVAELSGKTITSTALLTGVVVAAALACGMAWPMVVACLLISSNRMIRGIKKKIIEKTDEKVKAAFIEMEERVKQRLRKSEGMAVRKVRMICEAHVEQYGERVQALIQEKQEHQEQVWQWIKQLREESKYVNQLRTLFTNELERLSKME